MQTRVPQGRIVTGKNPRKNPRGISALVLAASLGLLFHTACTTTNTPPPDSSADGTARYIVIADTSFFKYGPAQASGPDLRLKKGQIVTMVEKHYGYSRVIDPDGDAGYVGTDDIAPAPSDVLAAPAPTPKKSGGGSRGGGAHGGAQPDFDQPNDSALPSKQQPSDVPVPSFRY